MVEQGGLSSGLGYLDIETELRKKKCTTQVEANAAELLVQERSLVRGYQVHMGCTVRMQEHPCFSMQNGGTPMGRPFANGNNAYG